MGPVLQISRRRSLAFLGMLCATGVGILACGQRRTMDARAFGVLCDGTTDDSSALQRALDASSDSGGGIIRISSPAPAKCVLGKLVSIPSKVELRVGAGVSLTRAAGFQGNMISNRAATTYGPRDVEVALTGEEGAVIDGGSNGSGADSVQRHHVRFRRVDGLRISGLTGVSVSGKYMFNVGDVSNFEVSEIDLHCSSDGVHVDGPARGVVVRGIRGTSGDDMVALTSAEYLQYADTQGDIVDCSIQDVSGDPGPTAVLKFATSEKYRIDRVDGRNLRHDAGGCVLAFANDCGAVNVGSVKLGGLSGYGYTMPGGKFGQLVVDGWSYSPVREGVPLIRILTQFDVLLLSRVRVISNAANNDIVLLDQGAAVVGGRIEVSDSHLQAKDAYAVRVGGASSRAGDVAVRGLKHSGPSGGGAVAVDGGSVAHVYAVRVTLDRAAWVLSVASGLTEVQFEQCSSTYGIVSASVSGRVIVKSSFDLVSPLQAVRSTGGSIRSSTVGFRCDASTLDGAEGDKCYNLRPGLNGGLLIGPATFTGTAWHSDSDPSKLYSPA